MQPILTTYAAISRSIENGRCPTTRQMRYIEVGRVVQAETLREALAALRQGGGARVGYQRIGTTYKLMTGGFQGLPAPEQVVFIHGAD